MIPKISSGSSYIGLLSYLENKPHTMHETENGIEVLTGTRRIDAANFENTRLRGLALLSDKISLADAFTEWDSKNKNARFENKVAHFSLSFAPPDTVDLDKVIAIAQEFLTKMGYEESPYVVYQHNDKSHNHIHIATSRVGEDGTKIAHGWEARRAIQICRVLEEKYHLIKVEPRNINENPLTAVAQSPRNASADLPFRDTIMQNLQYYLNKEGISDLGELQQRLLSQKIKMVTHDGTGTRLPKNGLRFYYMENDKIVSFLSGRDMGKGFFNRLEELLKANGERASVKEKTIVPPLAPNSAVQATSEKLYSVFNQCAASVLVSPNDLIELLGPAIQPEFSFDQDGNLKSLSFIVEGQKRNDFMYNGIKLLAELLAPYITQTSAGRDDKVIQRAITITTQYVQCTQDQPLTKQEIIEELNRHYIRLVEDADGSAILLINHLGKDQIIDLIDYPGGYSKFLQDCGYDGITELPEKLAKKIQQPVFLAEPLSIQEAATFNTLLNGNPQEIKDIFKAGMPIELTDLESKRLNKGAETLHTAAAIIGKAATQQETDVPDSKPSAAMQREVGEKILSVFNICAKSVLVTPKDIREELERYKIIPEFSIDKKGHLRGVSFIIKGNRYNGSDFVYNGMKLSAQLLAPYFVEKTLTGEKVIERAIQSTNHYIECTGDKLLSKQELIEVLNRNHIFLTEKDDGSAALIIGNRGKNMTIDLSNFPGGYPAFLKDAKWDGINELSDKLQKKIKNPFPLTSTLTLEEKFIYDTLLKGNLKEIQEVSKLETQVTLTDGEREKMYKSVQTMNYYNATHNKMSRAASSLKYADKKTGKKHSLSDLINALNLRGVAVVPVYTEPQVPGERRQLKNFHFRPIDDKSGNPPLNFFQTISAFDSQTLKALYDNPNPKDEELLSTDPKVEGVYFSYEPEVTKIILAAETEPSLMEDYKDKLLEDFPELEQEVEYIESLETPTGRGEPTYPEYNSHSISSMFKDYGTMPINRGVDGEYFKKHHRKYLKRSKDRSI